MKNIQSLISKNLDKLENNNTPLSQIIENCLRIAKALNNYDDYIWMSMETSDYCYYLIDKILEQMNSLLVYKLNYTSDQKNSFFEDYINRRSYSKDKIYNKSIYSLEIELNKIDADINFYSSSPAPNLHPVDYNMKCKLNDKARTVYVDYKKDLQVVYSRIRSKLFHYLTNIECCDIIEKKEPNNNIFIIHGHEEAKWRELKELLTKDGYNPIILNEALNNGSLTIIEKFEYYAKQCSYAIAIMTPDDIIIKGNNNYRQSRPNVIYEIGWFCGNLGRNRVSIIYKNDESLKMFSDFHGILQYRYYENISEIYTKIISEIKLL